MSGWFASRRRLQAEVAYLRSRLEEEKARPRLAVRPGPPPPPAESTTPDATETLLRGQIRALRQMTTVPGATELATELRTWRERAGKLDALLLQAQACNESLTRELRELRTPATPLPAQREPGLG
ncbi:hypothetical protein AW27_026495 [Streptomyces sp. PCS3-D2]|uniref:hypothetical protein n=1 Tax=Streptomyces sp. PCS3-D2 TaxID=1460244 RepID=UPI000451D9E3|nr:hypothetical protein [Streptomyces sp. PCS3-D2]WKV74252.1 hypothetical protein AW27_023710 [Streptomyces sp. PCS3-D2]WKV74758.1 hypothetical protein AW27_026495 [Streptomyces sp. PCS3-D2]